MDNVLQFTAENIGYITILLFALLIFFGILGFLVGLWKGVYKTTLKTLIKALLIVALIFSTPHLASWILSLSFPFIPEGRSIQSYLLNLITEYLEQANVSISPINGLSIYETINVFIIIVSCYAVFLLGLLLIQLLISLITAIFYHGIFRFLLPVESKGERRQRKEAKKNGAYDRYLLTEDLESVDSNGNLIVVDEPKKKHKLHRLAGGFVGLVQQFVFVSLFFVPLSGILTIAIDNKELASDVVSSLSSDESKEENSANLEKVIDSVENSIFYKYMHLGQLDVKISNAFGSYELNGQDVSLAGLLTSTLDVAQPVLNNGSITYDAALGKVTINFSRLLAVDTIAGLLSGIGENKMLLSLLPPILDLAISSVSSDFDLSQLDFSDIDYSSDLNLISSFYATVYSDLVDPIVNENGIDFQNFKFETSKLTDEEIEKYASAVSELCSAEVIEKNLPVFLSGIAKIADSNGYFILPLNPADYEGYTFGEDAKVIIRSFLQILRIFEIDIDSNIANSLSSLTDDVYTILEDENKRNVLYTALLGSEQQEGLFECDIIAKIQLGQLVNDVLKSSTALNSYVDSEVIVDLVNSYTQEELIEEFQSLFDIADIVLDKDSAIKLDDMENIDIFTQETSDELINILEVAKGSGIFKEIFPNVMKNLLYNKRVEISDNLFGLSAYNINYEAETFLDDFIQLADLLPEIGEVYDLLKSDKSVEQIITEMNVDTIESLLDILVNSELLNAEQRTGVVSKAQKNTNIHTVLVNLFSSDAFSSLPIVVPSIEELNDLEFSWNGDNGEIKKIGSFLRSLKKNTSLIASESFSFDVIDDYDALKELINNGLDSKFLEPTILALLNDNLKTYLGDIFGIEFDFNDMRNSLWKEDADELVDLMKLIKDENLSDFNLENINPDNFNRMLTILNDLNIIKTQTQYPDPFGYILYRTLVTYDVFNQMGISQLGYDVFSLPGLWSVERDANDRYLTTSGEINYLCSFVSLLKQSDENGISYLSTLKSGKMPKGFLNALGSSPVISSSLIRSFISFSLESMLSSLVLPEDINDTLLGIGFNLILDMSEEELRFELNNLDEIYTRMTRGGDNYILDMLEGTHVFSLSEQELEDLTQLMALTSQSAFFTTVKEGYSLSPIAILTSGLIDRMHLYPAISMQDQFERQDPVVLGTLAEVVDWKTEARLFQSIIVNIQGYQPSDISISGSTLTYETALTLFDTMNQSEIFHKAPIYMIKNGFERSGINDMLQDKKNSVRHDPDFYVHLTLSSEDVLYWENEYKYILELVFNSSLKDIFFESSVTLDQLDFTTIDMSVFYYLGKIDLIREGRSYLIYNIIDSYSEDSADSENFKISSLFLDSTFNPYLGDNRAYRFEDLIFENAKLLDSTGQLDEKKTLFDLALVNDMIQLTLQDAPKIFHATTFEDLADKEILDETGVTTTQRGVHFLDLIEACYTFENDLFYRSDFASELSAGIMTLVLNNENLVSSIGNSTIQLDFYADSYRLTNFIEGRAFDGLIKLISALGNLSLEKMYLTKSELLEIFAYFGGEIKQPTREDYADEGSYQVALKQYNAYEYCLTLSEYQQTGNSLLACQIDQYLLSVPVKVSEDSSPTTLRSLCGNMNGANTNYLELINSIAMI